LGLDDVPFPYAPVNSVRGIIGGFAGTPGTALVAWPGPVHVTRRAARVDAAFTSRPAGPAGAARGLEQIRRRSGRIWPSLAY